MRPVPQPRCIPSTRKISLASQFPQSRPSLSFSFVSASWHRGLRNGTWNSLGSSEKALYRCALWITKTRGCVVNRTLVAQILAITRHFLESIRTRIAATGKRRAENMLKSYSSQRGVFGWVPQLEEWLRNANYVFYLGVNSQP